jgi:hypothetical protein
LRHNTRIVGSKCRGLHNGADLRCNARSARIATQNGECRWLRKCISLSLGKHRGRNSGSVGEQNTFRVVDSPSDRSNRSGGSDTSADLGKTYTVGVVVTVTVASGLCISEAQAIFPRGSEAIAVHTSFSTHCIIVLACRLPWSNPAALSKNRASCCPDKSRSLSLGTRALAGVKQSRSEIGKGFEKSMARYCG